MEQPWLIPYVNPLGRRLGKAFFQALPRSPGVYLMMGGSKLLYVGKAKDLRARLLSYRYASPGRVSRKVIRLVHAIDKIRFETCVSEKAALLRENELLRKHRPPFNVANTRPESYYLVGIAIGERTLRLRLTTDPSARPAEENEILYGAFKGRAAVSEGYQALLRLLSAAYGEDTSPFRYPPEWRLAIPPRVTKEQERALGVLLKRFLGGTSNGLLKSLGAALLSNENLPRFTYSMLQEDLGRLLDLYKAGPARNRRLRKRTGFEAALIPQDALDDLIVRALAPDLA